MGMKMIALLCLLLVGCSGCGEKTIDNNHGFGFHYDVQGMSGIKLRYKPMVSDSDILADINQYEIAFTQTQTCTGLSAAIGPFIILVSPSDPQLIGTEPGPPKARYFFDPSLILINPVYSLSGLRHDLVHFLLDQTGFPRDRNIAHDSDLFYICDGQH